MPRVMKMTLTSEFSDGTSLTIVAPTEKVTSGLPPYGDNPRFLTQQVRSGMAELEHGLRHVVEALFGDQLDVGRGVNR